MKNKRFSALLLIVIMTATMCFHAFSPVASAFPDETGSISLTITDSLTGEPVENVSFHLYFVATAHSQGTGITYKYKSPYDECNMAIGNLQNDQLPLHLLSFATENSLSYTRQTSDANGNIVFDNLTPGAYLVAPDYEAEHPFTISPFIVSTPLYDEVNGEWIFDINATPKIEYRVPTDTQEVTYITVKKQWKSNTENPDSVTVSLLRDFRKVETITLSAENNWSYRWDNLSKKYAWNVIEENVPDGYIVSYDTSSNTVVVTNEKPFDKETTTKPEDTTIPDELIETGQLNWPVPVLATAGLLLFSLGWAMLNLGKKTDEEQ